MSTGDVRRNQSANLFNSSKKAGEKINQRSKPLWQEDKNTSGIVLDTPSTSTLIGEEPQPNLNLLFIYKQREKQTTYLPIKVNRLQDRNT